MNRPAEFSRDGSAHNRIEGTLHRIAEAIGCPVDSFFPASSDPGTAELLRLWASLNAPEARHRVLEILREAIRSEQAEL